MKQNQIKIKIFLIFIIINNILFTSCEIFTIKGQKIVVEESNLYTQTTPIGCVKIFITELINENYLAAADLMIKENAKALNAAEKYEATSDLARMKRFIEGKNIKNETIDTISGSFIVNLEYENGNKAIFYTIEKEKLFYITSYKRE